MSYEKLGFVSGQKLKAEHLNHMEEGIANAGGVTSWNELEDKPFGATEPVVIISETSVTFVDGNFVSSSAPDLYVKLKNYGKYTIIWDGESYPVTLDAMEGDENNRFYVCEGDPYIQPLIIGIYEDHWVLRWYNDPGTTSHTFSLATTSVVIPIDEKYIPESVVESAVKESNQYTDSRFSYYKQTWDDLGTYVAKNVLDEYHLESILSQDTSSWDYVGTIQNWEEVPFNIGEKYKLTLLINSTSKYPTVKTYDAEVVESDKLAFISPNNRYDYVKISKSGKYTYDVIVSSFDYYGEPAEMSLGRLGINELPSSYLPKAAAVADATDAPTAEQFNALLASLRDAGYLSK